MKFTKTVPSFYLQEGWAAPPGVGAYTLTRTLDPQLPPRRRVAEQPAGTRGCLFPGPLSFEPRPSVPLPY